MHRQFIARVNRLDVCMKLKGKKKSTAYASRHVDHLRNHKTLVTCNRALIIRTQSALIAQIQNQKNTYLKRFIIFKSRIIKHGTAKIFP